MKITSDQWADYINKLSTLNSRGSKLVQDWIDKHGTEDVDALIDYCYKVIARYGTASAELTASMYEAIAQAEEVFIQPAELADIASYGDAAKAVQGSLLQSPSGQLVKQTDQAGQRRHTCKKCTPRRRRMGVDSFGRYMSVLPDARIARMGKSIEEGTEKRSL